MTTICDVLSKLSGIINSDIASNAQSLLTMCISSQNGLTITARDSEGIQRSFEITVVQTGMVCTPAGLCRPWTSPEPCCKEKQGQCTEASAPAALPLAAEACCISPQDAGIQVF